MSHANARLTAYGRATLGATTPRKLPETVRISPQQQVNYTHQLPRNRAGLRGGEQPRQAV